MDCLYFEDFFISQPLFVNDHFPSNESWKIEIDKWLSCVHSLDKEYYERGKTRVKQDRWKREEFLAEIRSIYYLESKLHCKILELEPNRIDFSFRDHSNAVWLAEVKCPSYVKELLERDNLKEKNLKRKMSPKYISGEGGSFDFKSGYTNAIKNSVQKFQSLENNLLIISDDRMISLITDPFAEENIVAECATHDLDHKISAVLLLAVECRLDNKFYYLEKMIGISRSPVFSE